MHLLAQVADAATQSPTAEVVAFWVFAVIGVGAGIAMITMRNIIHAALMLVLNFLAIAALYITLQSSFLGIIQIIVYAGAIMVLFLFVIMLLGVDRDDLLVDVKRWHRVGAVVLTVLVLAGALFAFGGYLSADSRCGGQAPTEPADPAAERCVGLDDALAENPNGSVGVIADRMFTRWTFPFEASALLLVVATIGALILGRREDPESEESAFFPQPEQPTPDDPDALVTSGHGDPRAPSSAEASARDAAARPAEPTPDDREDR